MYNVKVDVSLSERGKALIGKDNFTYVLNINDADIARNLEGKRDYILKRFEESIMPAGMYVPESAKISIINFEVREKEWMSVEVHLNGSTTIYIPFEVYFGEDDPSGALIFHLKPIDGFNYDVFNNNLRNSAYTNRTFSNVEKITRYKFSTNDMRPTNKNAQINFVAHPMASATMQNVIETIKHNEVYKNAVARVAELADNLDKFSTNDLQHIIDTVDDMLEECDMYNEYA